MSAINKRQQARNERALQDLIRSVPGNDKCADCGAKNPGTSSIHNLMSGFVMLNYPLPGWASWSVSLAILESLIVQLLPFLQLDHLSDSS